jgi:3-oxoacyl-ACP reductase-like protein
MAPTNIVVDKLESYGVRTFSVKEMAFHNAPSLIQHQSGLI